METNKCGIWCWCNIITVTSYSNLLALGSNRVLQRITLFWYYFNTGGSLGAAERVLVQFWTYHRNRLEPHRKVHFMCCWEAEGILYGRKEVQSKQQPLLFCWSNQPPFIFYCTLSCCQKVKAMNCQRIQGVVVIMLI